MPEDFIMMPIPTSRFAAVCALLGGASLAAVSAGNPGSGASVTPATPSASATAPSSTPAPVVGSSDHAATSSNATTAASPSDGERDAAGVVWDAEKHASTKGKTNAGLWRMKVGVKRPAGEGEDAIPGNGTGTETATPSSIATSSDATATSPAPANTVEEDDEFAAYRTAAASTPTPRNWTDGDLSKLCNQVAAKIGGERIAEVKDVIARFVPDGVQPHSRNIPADQRETFAQEVEKTFDLKYDG